MERAITTFPTNSVTRSRAKRLAAAVVASYIHELAGKPAISWQCPTPAIDAS